MAELRQSVAEHARRREVASRAQPALAAIRAAPKPRTQPAAAAAAGCVSGGSDTIRRKRVAAKPQDRMTNAKDLAGRSYWAQKEGGHKAAQLILTATGEHLVDEHDTPMRKYSKGASLSWPRTPPAKGGRQRAALTSSEAFYVRKAAVQFQPQKDDGVTRAQFWPRKVREFCENNVKPRSKQFGVWAKCHLNQDSLKYWAHRVGEDEWDWHGTQTEEGRAAQRKVAGAKHKRDAEVRTEEQALRQANNRRRETSVAANPRRQSVPSDSRMGAHSATAVGPVGAVMRTKAQAEENKKRSHEEFVRRSAKSPAPKTGAGAKPRPAD